MTELAPPVQADQPLGSAPSAPGSRRPPMPPRVRVLLIACLVLGAAATAGVLLAGGAGSNGGADSARVSWTQVPGAVRARVYLNGRLIDELPAAAGPSYELHRLWPNTRFPVTIDLMDNRGRILASYARTVRASAAGGPVARLYSPDTFINTPIGASPRLEPASSSIVAHAILPYANRANLANDDRWGIPIYTADSQSPSYQVGCRYYGCDRSFGAQRIPAGAQPDTGSDGHMVVMQPDGHELDMWIAQRTADGWTAGSRWVANAAGPAANCTVQHACGGADAADFALAAGLIRPEEIAQGHIDHALAITTPDTRRGYIACPATGGDGRHPEPNALPIGAHLQLDPRIDVAALAIPGWEKVIAVALQKYGAYVIDTGGSVAFYAQSDLGRGFDAWTLAGVPSSSPLLTGLPWGSMRVLAMKRCGS